MMEDSGTWGDSVTRLLPSMSTGGVERVVATIEAALPYLSEEGKGKAEAVLSEFY